MVNADTSVLVDLSYGISRGKLCVACGGEMFDFWRCEERNLNFCIFVRDPVQI